MEGRKGKSVWVDVWKIADDAAGEACLPVWLVRHRPDPQDSLSETDEAGEDEGYSDQYLLDQQFESTNPGVAPNPRRSNDKLALHIR